MVEKAPAVGTMARPCYGRHSTPPPWPPQHASTMAATVPTARRHHGRNNTPACSGCHSQHAFAMARHSTPPPWPPQHASDYHGCHSTPLPWPPWLHAAARVNICHGRHNTPLPWPPQHASAMAATAHKSLPTKQMVQRSAVNQLVATTTATPTVSAITIFFLCWTQQIFQVTVTLVVIPRIPGTVRMNRSGHTM